MPSYLDTLQRSLHQHLPSVIPPPNSASLPPWLLSLALIVPSVLLLTPLVSPAPPKRTSVIKATNERVLIIGASSGCGEDLAKRYASLGASVCVVARSKDNLEKVAATCRSLLPGGGAANKILLYAGDICSPDDMVAVRELIVREWQGLDTLHIISGLSSTQTLLEASSVNQVAINFASGQQANRHHKFEADGPNVAEANLPAKDGLQALADEARRLADVNMVGVAVSVAAFLPLLSSTSESPLIHHLSSVAGLVPAPTRALYAATKAGGLACFRSAAVENGGGRSGVRFLATCPGTIDNDFRRKSSSSVRGIAPAEGFDKALLSVDDVTNAIIHHCSLAPTSTPITLPIPIPFVGRSLTLQVPFFKLPPNDTVFLPSFPYRPGYWLLDTPLRGITERMARRKYGLE
ncbi:hypothetical protein QFC20_002189 [Naganishia adeliensis]|uniref:Uncharacterized protein n=1 Tax=Naganishia adeliensis TaxID=92952 RepID=A0ACC2WL87_9TREE|nr:hypothetical protein QFC20_002189 [Naganishia adeliensis]